MRTQQKIINLFGDTSVSSIKQVFSIANEDDLDQCWSYFHQSSDLCNKELGHFISLFYEFSNQYILNNSDPFFELILEQTESRFYLTVWNKIVVQELRIFLEKHKINFLFEKNRLSIGLDKYTIVKDEMLTKQAKNRQILDSIERDNHATRNLPRYDFMLENDLHDLIELCDDMNDILFLAKQNHFESTHFIRLRSCFSLFSVTLRYYPPISNVATSITTFSAIISTNQERFKTLKSVEMDMIEGFISNIELWLKTLFIEGGANLTFMDASLNADVETIKSFICPVAVNPKRNIEEDIDDIFNF